MIGSDQARSVSVLPDRSAVIAGAINETAMFGSLPDLVSAGGADIFVAKVDATGSFEEPQHVVIT